MVKKPTIDSHLISYEIGRGEMDCVIQPIAYCFLFKREGKDKPLELAIQNKNLPLPEKPGKPLFKQKSKVF
jgi:hypothetical protein